MLYEHAHNRQNTSSAPDLPSSTSELASFDSGGGRYEPGLILYPYRRYSVSTTTSSPFLQAFNSADKGKRTGWLSVGVEASSSNVTVADISMPLTSTDPAGTMVGATRDLEKDEEACVDIEGRPELVKPPGEVVVPHPDPEPAPMALAQNSTGALALSRTTGAPHSFPTQAMGATASNSRGDTIVDGFIIDGKVVSVIKSAGPRRKVCRPRCIETSAKRTSAIPGENSRMYVFKQGLATIGRGIPNKPLRLGEKVKGAVEPSGFKSEEAKSNDVEFETAKLGGGASPAEDRFFEASTQPRGVNPIRGVSSLANPGDIDCHDGSGTVEPGGRDVNTLSSAGAVSIIHPSYSSDIASDEFIVNGEPVLANGSTSLPQDTSANIDIGNRNRRSAVPSIPIFAQRPSSGEHNRKFVFRRMSALVQAPPMKPLGLKGTGVGPGSSHVKSKATGPDATQGDPTQPSKSWSSVVQSSGTPSNLVNSCDIHSSRAKSRSTIVHDLSPPTDAELMELFDIVEALYSAPTSPEESPSLPNGIIADAFVLGGKVVSINRSAGSRQDVLANIDAGNNKRGGAESPRQVDMSQVGMLRSLIIWFLCSRGGNRWGMCRKASVVLELPLVKPLRLKNKSEALAKLPGGIKSSEIKTNEAKSDTVGLAVMEASVRESVEVRSSGTRSSIAGPTDVQPVEAKLDPFRPDLITDTTDVAATLAVSDLIVTTSEDRTKVAIETSGRKPRKAGLDRKLLFAYHMFRAPRPSSNKSETTQGPLGPSLVSMAAADSGSAPAPISEGQSSEGLASALEPDEFDYDVDHSEPELDPFEYDHFLGDQSSAANLGNAYDDDDDDDDDIESDPFKYDFILDLASSSIDVQFLEPELESRSTVSSPESTPPTTPTSMDLPRSALPPLDLAGKLSGPFGVDRSWAWNIIDEVDDDRDGAIGTAL
ncbi:hypothetical protein FRC10_008457 [Ceratobasidium sp. 414]|nr:hypothetical protein FRC10_008457 [Ceratobasidium sp. 414]